MLDAGRWIRYVLCYVLGEDIKGERGVLAYVLVLRRRMLIFFFEQ